MSLIGYQGTIKSKITYRSGITYLSGYAIIGDNKVPFSRLYGYSQSGGGWGSCPSIGSMTAPYTMYYMELTGTGYRWSATSSSNLSGSAVTIVITGGSDASSSSVEQWMMTNTNNGFYYQICPLNAVSLATGSHHLSVMAGKIDNSLAPSPRSAIIDYTVD